MVRVRLALVQLQEAWNGGHQVLMLLPREHVGFSMFMLLAQTDHLIIFLVKTLGWRHGKVAQTHVRLQ